MLRAVALAYLGIKMETYSRNRERLTQNTSPLERKKKRPYMENNSDQIILRIDMLDC